MTDIADDLATPPPHKPHTIAKAIANADRLIPDAVARGEVLAALGLADATFDHRRPVTPCDVGSVASWWRHKRRGEQCSTCDDARREHHRAYDLARRARLRYTR